MRVIIVSNRLPVSCSFDGDRIDIVPSIGGLATGLSSFFKKRNAGNVTDFVWIGWPGIHADEKNERKIAEALFNHHKCIPVFLKAQCFYNFYTTVCNSTLWPVFHSMPEMALRPDVEWEDYVSVNKLFLVEILKVAKPGDVLWIHDFHLMLLPKLIREKCPEASVGFFLHIPFPMHTMFGLLSDSWRHELISGVLAADVVGFHTREYVDNFLCTVGATLDCDIVDSTVLYNGHVTKVAAYPMGIDYEAFYAASCHEQMQKEKYPVLPEIGDRKVILSVDRLDYTKGIINRLRAFEHFLIVCPDWQGKVILNLFVAPSRVDIPAHIQLKIDIDRTVSEINRRLSRGDWTPVIYQYEKKTFEELVVLYTAADVALITPLRDGMNLIAKEFVACCLDGKAVLILSERAGASVELSDALLVNPFNIEDIAGAICEALNMPDAVRIQKMECMQARLRANDVAKWGASMLHDIVSMRSGIEVERYRS